MNIKTDKFIKTGKTHFICQDYILTGSHPKCIILADGCSGVENSDVGARLLCLAAAKYLKNYKLFLNELDYTNISMGQQIIHSAEIAAKVIDIPTSCLAATLMIAYYHEGYIYVAVYGDGNVILLDNDNELHFYEISYSENRPFYLSYYLFPDNYKLYKETNTEQFIRSKVGTNKIEFNLPFQRRFKADQYKVISIASDGLSSWSPPFDLMEVFKNCVYYKNTNGLFLQRRMIRFISTLEKNRNNHLDDISIGAFYMEE